MYRMAAFAIASFVAFASPAQAAGGTFSGASGHKTSGSVTVTQKGNKLIISLGSNFRLDGAPDPYVTLGSGSRPVKGGTAGLLRKISGAGSYSVPATAATKAANQVVIWCKKFGVPLGVARLN